MTTPNPITPPPELVQQWVDQLLPQGSMKAFTVAAQWGANQELEACSEWLVKQGWFSSDEHEAIEELRAARRPRPPSLKEQALGLLNEGPVSELLDHEVDTIRRALEALDD
jgi:hypothetical protein